jgi:hypothetical protein
VKSFNIFFSTIVIICVSLFGFSDSYDVEYIGRLEPGKINNHNLSIQVSKKITAVEIYTENYSKINCKFDDSIMYIYSKNDTDSCIAYILPNKDILNIKVIVSYSESSVIKPLDYKIHVYRMNYSDLKDLKK